MLRFEVLYKKCRRKSGIVDSSLLLASNPTFSYHQQHRPHFLIPALVLILLVALICAPRGLAGFTCCAAACPNFESPLYPLV